MLRAEYECAVQVAVGRSGIRLRPSSGERALLPLAGLGSLLQLRWMRGGKHWSWEAQRESCRFSEKSMNLRNGCNLDRTGIQT